MKKGAAKELALHDDVRKALDAIAKKAAALAKGKLPTNVWDYVHFLKAEAAARDKLLENDLGVFLSGMRDNQDNQKGNKIQLEKGDIVLYVDRGWATKVSVAQGAQRLLVPMTNFGTYKGSIYTHHAAVIVDNSIFRLGVAHSVGGDGVSFKGMDEHGVKLKPDTYGSYMIFRLKDARARKKFAEAVSLVAHAWTGPKSKKMEYADAKDMVLAAVKMSIYGPAAEKRMRQYVAAVAKGGIEGAKFYCSQLVIALYQAAMGADSATYMALHADYTSPMKLHHYLADSPKIWTHVGTESYPER